MAQNNNQNGAQTAPTTQSKAIAAMKDELANSVLRRIGLQANGGLVVPKDYAVIQPSEPCMASYLEMLWEDSTNTTPGFGGRKPKRPVANSLLDMVLQGMDIQKKQGYFIPIKTRRRGSSN